MRNLLVLAANLLCAAISLQARGQVIYSPVQYQYGGQDAYFYGGNSSAVHAAAMAFSHEVTWGRHNGFAMASGNVQTHREVIPSHARVFVDAIPWCDAAIYGYTPDDAKNEAYSRVPTYFSKRSLLTQGVWSGSVLVVPADALSQVTADQPKPISRPPATHPAPLLIIPKGSFRTTVAGVTVYHRAVSHRSYPPGNNSKVGLTFLTSNWKSYACLCLTEYGI